VPIGIVTIHSPGRRLRASSAIRCWMSAMQRTGPGASRELDHLGMRTDAL